MATAIVSNEQVEDEAVEDTAEDVDKQAANIVTDGLVASWEDFVNADGVKVIEASLRGEFLFHIIEDVDELGMPVYKSSLFKNPQDDLNTAFTLSFKNAGNRAFKKTWNTLFPPEERKRLTRERQEEKIARLTSEAQQETARADIAVLQSKVLADALMKGEEPDFEAAGLPVPEFWAAAKAAKK